MDVSEDDERETFRVRCDHIRLALRTSHTLHS